MSQGAKVKSIEMVREFRVAFSKFGSEVSQALASVDAEIGRMMDWLGHDQLRYWQHEVRRREDAVGEAKTDLSRCLIFKQADGSSPACTDQKKALEKAKRRLQEAEEKLAKVREWCRVLEQEIAEYRGPAQQLSNVVEGELPGAYALLDRKIEILESYANLGSSAAADAGATPSMAMAPAQAAPAEAAQAARAETQADRPAEEPEPATEKDEV
jgi:hypothetical protein